MNTDRKMPTQGLDLDSEKPLFLQLKERLIEDLISPPNAEGKFPTFKEIAEKYGVSVGTAVKTVEKLKSEGLIYTKRSKGIYLKGDQKTSKAIRIAVTILDIGNISGPFLSEMIKGVSREGNEANFHLELYTTPHKDLDKEKHPLFWNGIRKREIDGLVIDGRMPTRDVASLLHEGIPFVWLQSDLPNEKIYTVLTDKFQSLNLIITHLVKLRYRKIALLVAEEDQAFRSVFDILCVNYGLEGRYYIKEAPEKEAGYSLAKESLSKNRPEVLITLGSELTMSILAFISKSNLSFPKDVALVGIVSNPDGYFSAQKITTLLIPVSVMARKAIQMLQAALNGEPVPEKRLIIPTRLIVRGSCGFPMKEKEEIVVSDLDGLNALSYPKRKGD
ncbi:MAG: LacI family DNA-binding transcriptional regulator [Candidatus Omnitrophota bacterium]